MGIFHRRTTNGAGAQEHTLSAEETSALKARKAAAKMAAEELLTQDVNNADNNPQYLDDLQKKDPQRANNARAAQIDRHVGLARKDSNHLDTLRNKDSKLADEVTSFLVSVDTLQAKWDPDYLLKLAQTDKPRADRATAVIEKEKKYQGPKLCLPKIAGAKESFFASMKKTTRSTSQPRDAKQQETATIPVALNSSPAFTRQGTS